MKNWFEKFIQMHPVIHFTVWSMIGFIVIFTVNYFTFYCGELWDMESTLMASALVSTWIGIVGAWSAYNAI